MRRLCGGDYRKTSAQCREIGEQIGRSGEAVKNIINKRLRLEGEPIQTRGATVYQPPKSGRDWQTIFAEQAEAFERKAGHHEAKGGVEVHIPGDEPFGLLLVGDPHVDDNGTDLGQLAYCLQLASRTERVWALNIGDLTNNWVGRLKAIYAHQNATEDEAVELMRWLLQAAPWLMVILGNHDKWGPSAELLCKQYGVPYVSHGCKLSVACGDTGRVLRVDCRHNHRGHSMYNPAHGQLKQSYRGSDCHLIVGGHTHTSAHTIVRNGVTRHLSHCIRLSAFKVWDDYADAQGFDADSIGPAALAVINPKAETDTGFVSVYWDLDLGVQMLNAMRG